MSERTLAGQVVAAEAGTDPEEVSRAERRAAHIDLVQVHLPLLEAAGFVVRDEDDETVTTTDHPLFGDARFRRIVEETSEGWDDVIDCLAADRRRAVLAVLEDRDEPMARGELAEAVAAREAGDAPTPDVLRNVRISLHHVHLPKLADAGLIECDRDDETVSYRGHPELEVEWFDAPATGAVPTILRAVREAGNV